uniref:Uncharacterized protein n=2 Tax=Timema TaxID=61471 RepID=A0A7R9JYU4_TIMGE|nr:unnamed protein product [Timema genevievae]
MLSIAPSYPSTLPSDITESEEIWQQLTEKESEDKYFLHKTCSSLSNDIGTHSEAHAAGLVFCFRRTSAQRRSVPTTRKMRRWGGATKWPGTMVQRNKKGTPLYSKEDIREQYCITSKQLDVLEQAQGASGLFGCLSSYHESSCRSRHSLLSVCVRRKVPSDENLHELYRRPPIPRWPRYLPPPEFYREDLECSYFRRRPHAFCNPAHDPKRYTWLPEDEECTRMERPRPIRPPDHEDSHSDYEGGVVNHRSCLASSSSSSSARGAHYMSYSSEYLACPAHPDLPPPPPPPPAAPHAPRTKHVSFARSHTLTSFDDAVVGISATSGSKVLVARSQERLIDGKKVAVETPPGDRRQQQSVNDSPKIVLVEKLKRAPMKTQATQTEVCLGRKPLAPNYLSLSPRTIHRVRMVSQGAQTNGGINNSRRLMKSYSEAGEGRFGAAPCPTGGSVYQKEPFDEHEPLHRTQSEEPPRSNPLLTPPTWRYAKQLIIVSSYRSPFLVTTPPESLGSPLHISSSSATLASTTDTLKTTTPDSSGRSKSGKSKTYKEIFIDFEPQCSERRTKKRTLQKTLSEGEILIDRRRVYGVMDSDLNDASPMLASVSQEGLSDDNYQYYPREDVFLEPLEKRSASLFSSTPADLAVSSNIMLEDLQEDEFHENFIYRQDLVEFRGLFRKRSVSLEDGVSSTASDADLPLFQQQMSQEDDYEEEEEEEEQLETKSIPVSSEMIAEVQRTSQEEQDEDMEICDEEEEDGVCEKEQEMLEKNGDISSTIVSLAQRSSPFASSDSLANDVKDHSDSIWNESQATVLHADSDNNGTGISCSDLSSLSALCPAVLSLTPSSRRKQLLLLQHQQRSSMDTEALDEEFDASQVPQGPPSPRLRVEGPQYPRPTFSVTTPSQDEPTEPDDAVVPSKRPSPLSEKLERVVTKPPRDVVMSPSQSRRVLRRRRSPAGYRTPDSSTEQQSLESIDSLTRNNGSTADLLLGRTDSGKTGTDISETSTTEDYVTANDNNSGTDTSSRRSVSYHLPKDRGGGQGVAGVGGGSAGAGDCSSFESASSMYSLTRGELNSDELAQVCCSPPPIMEENSSDVPTTPQLESEDNQASTTPRVSIDMTTAQKKGSGHEGTSPSGDSSSSSGSYSVEGSSNDLDKLPPSTVSPAPSADKNRHRAKGGSVSDEEHSGHYSSSGYYESPADEDEEAEGYDLGSVSGGERREWTEEEKRKKKNAFKLDFSPIMDKEEIILQPTDSEGSRKTTPSRRGKSRSRSPVQHHRRVPSTLPGVAQRRRPTEINLTKKPITPGMVRSPAMHEGFRTEDWGTLQRTTPVHTPEEAAPVSANNIGTSDESSQSVECTAAQQQSSPRRHRRVRDSPRRKQGSGSGGRSPTATTQRTRRRSGSTEEKSAGSAATLARRRSSIPAKSPGSGLGEGTGGEDPSAQSLVPKGSRLSPHRYSRSPASSPSRRLKSKGSPKMIADSSSKGTISPDSTRLKALSAESLRSVSPGSDSVFYSESADHSSNAANLTDNQGVLCHHCGREVDKSTLSGVEIHCFTKNSEALGIESKTSGSVTINFDHKITEEVLVSTMDGEGTCESVETEQPDIVQPPAGFADSPEGPRGMKPSSGRLYKKLEKRFRSEDRGGHGERRHHSRFRCEGVRAKSEERGKEDRVKVRPLARSTDASMEVLKTADSSPNMARDNSVSDLLTDDEEDQDTGIMIMIIIMIIIIINSLQPSSFLYNLMYSLYRHSFPDNFLVTANMLLTNLITMSSTFLVCLILNVHVSAACIYTDSYKNSTWIYIGDSEEIHVWQKPDTRADDKDDKSGDNAESTSIGVARRGSSESTGSEKDFRRKYQAITHRMVHRKSSVEMYKRLQSKSFADTSCCVHTSLHQALENILHQMLMVWCKQTLAIKVVSGENDECDKTVVVRRESGEFGFRIHGSRPVVVSAIEPDTPAETSGLEVGDIVISVNSVNVLEASHSEVVKLAHAGSDTLQLEVARTCNVLTPIVREPGAGSPLYSGYLWKLRTCDSGNNNRKWIERWFCLKRDNCLYYYKNDNESQPLGALMLANYTATRTPDSGRPYSFQVLRKGAAGLHLAADGEESATRWLAVVSHSIERNAQMDEWLDISKRNLKLSPSAVQQPDCFGYLMKLGEKWKSWKRRYCVLKDACLFFYKDGTSDSALVMIPMINILVTIMIRSQGWCASMDTEYKTPPLAGKGLSLKFFHPNLDNDISTSTLTQRWTRNDGSLPSNTLSTVGLKSADASASDVQPPNTKKAKKLTKKQLRLSFDANAGPPHLEEERKLSLENGHHSYQLLAT